MSGRLLLINHTGELGGSEYGLLDIAKHFGAQRCHVVLFGDGPLRPLLETAGIGVTILAGGRGMMGVRREAGRLRAFAAAPAVALMAFRLARIARGYEILYCNSQKAAVVTLLMQRFVRKPVIWHLHDILSAEHFAGLQRATVVNLANLSARTVIAISDVCARSFIDSGGNPRRLAVVPNGVDARRFENIEQIDVAEIRRSIGAGEGKLVGLFGRISTWKGQEVLISALAQLPGVEAIMVGDALFGELEYKATLMEQARQLGVENRIHWLGYRNNIPALLRSVDIVIHASTSAEPFGRVIVEGMLAKRPVLASSHGASAEIMGQGHPWMVPPGDGQALADAIAGVLALSPDQREGMVQDNYHRAMQRFSLQAMLRGIDQAVGLAPC